MSGMTKAERLAEMKQLYIQRSYSDIELAEKLSIWRIASSHSASSASRGLGILVPRVPVAPAFGAPLNSS